MSTVVHRAIKKTRDPNCTMSLLIFIPPFLPPSAPPPGSPRCQHTCGRPLGIGNVEFVRGAERCPSFRQCRVVFARRCQNDVQYQ
jgi:hypothetical protein